LWAAPATVKLLLGERAVDKSTTAFAFDQVFGLNSRQDIMNVFIYLFIFVTCFVHLSSFLLLLLNVIYTDFSVCVVSCRKLGSKTLGVASSSKILILNVMNINQLAQNWTVFGH
jgi:hypothetical protein